MAKIDRLLATTEPPQLGPGPRAGVQSESELARNLDQFFRDQNVPAQNQHLIRALVLLWHDHLDQAHRIAQEIDTPNGAFVHAIMHRREPDYGNAKYWFRHVGKHPAFPAMAKSLSALQISGQHSDLRQLLLPKGDWDPFAFVDACERAARGSDGDEALLRQIQLIETRALLDELLD